MHAVSYRTGILEALKDWGLTVHEVDGWRTRGSSDFDPRGHVFHHDVVPDFPGTNDPIPNIIVAGRSDLPGPLANFWLERDGDVHLCAAGRANHAGEGGWNGLTGNSSVWGTEMNNLGVPSDVWPEVQLEAAARLAAATAEFSEFTSAYVCGHKEWAPTRKIDPHTINMAAFRRQVELQEKRQEFSIVDQKTEDYFNAKFRVIRDRDRTAFDYLRAIRKEQGLQGDDLDDLERDMGKLLADEG